MKWTMIKVGKDEVQAQFEALPGQQVRCSLTGGGKQASGMGDNEEEALSDAKHDWLTQYGEADNKWWPGPDSDP